MSFPEKIIIVAMTRDRVIGCGGKIPWQIPEELARFREWTIGHTVVMGRQTFASIGRPLAGRRNIVVSSSMAPLPGVEVCGSLGEAVRLAEQAACEKIFFIGGAGIYEEALPLADTLIVSWIEGEYAGDTCFPPDDGRRWGLREGRRFAAFTQEIYTRLQPVVG
jgi:dihydrofolate reductase